MSRFFRLARFAAWQSAAQLALAAASFGFDPLFGGPATTQPAAPGCGIQFDLSAARFTSLTADTLFDEDVNVSAEPDKLFLALPFLYDPAAGDLSLARTSVKGKDAKTFHGFRLLAPKDGRLSPDDYDRPVIYERLELKAPLLGNEPGEAVPPTLTARNLSVPRKGPADKSKAPAFKPSADTLTVTGYAALLLEIPKNAKKITISLVGCEETIDLEHLNQAGRPISIQPSPDPEQPESAEMPAAVADVAAHVTDGTAAVAALAIDQLAAQRRNWSRPDAARWVGAVDAAVLSAAGRDAPMVQRAAWRYFSSGGMAGMPSPNLSPQSLDYLAAADDALQLRWLNLIACGLGFSDCGRAWSGSAPADYFRESAPATGKALLGAILRSEDENVCAAAVGLLMRFDASLADASMLNAASTQAHIQILEHLEKHKDQVAAARLVLALLRSPQPGTASKLAALSEKLHVCLERDDPSLIADWEGLNTPDERAALFIALAGVDLGDQIYAERLAKLLRASTVDSKADAEPEFRVREAAWTCLVQQAKRAVSPAPPAPGTKNKSRLSRAAFPLLVSRTARDPLVSGLADAARRGPRTIRSQALVLLLQCGYADEAARAIADPGTTTQQREVLLKELCAKDESIVGRSALTAMLGHLIRRDSAANAPLILNRLDDIRKKTPPDQVWRLAASLRAGINFAELDRLVASSDPSVSEKALRWLHELGHMSDQDQQGLAAARKLDDRAAMLDKIDYRRARRANGTYGVLLVVETAASSAQEQTQVDGRPNISAPRSLWRAPQRRTIVAPNVEFDSMDEPEPNGDQKLRVLWNGNQIGDGLLINKAKSVGGPGRFSPVLQVAAWNDLSEGRLAGPSVSDTAVGPLVLQHRALANPLTPGTINLDIADYLRATLTEQDVLLPDEIAPLVPRPCPITLRYASFGSYYGCTPDLPQPDLGAPPPPRKLLGVMMILEWTD